MKIQYSKKSVIPCHYVTLGLEACCLFHLVGFRANNMNTQGFGPVNTNEQLDFLEVFAGWGLDITCMPHARQH